MTELASLHCESIPSNTKPLSLPKVEKYLNETQDWEPHLSHKSISKTVTFKNFQYVMQFLNAIGWIMQKEDHHADVSYNYNSVTIKLTTHSIRGLTINDFIIAAKIDALLD